MVKRNGFCFGDIESNTLINKFVSYKSVKFLVLNIYVVGQNQSGETPNQEIYFPILKLVVVNCFRAPWYNSILA
jgi:hypothetical protein